MKTKQSGFTLVELAISMVIIGLLLAGILKGQELIGSGKVKNLGADFRAITTAYYAYQDKFRAIPGDDKAAVAHVGAGATEIGNGNGAIEGAWDSVVSVTTESVLFWQHLRLAGLMPGSTTVSVATTGNTYLPTNSVGGRLGISNTNPVGTMGSDPVFSAAFYVCSGGITGKLAKQLDATLDDGVGNTGSMRVVNSDGTTAVAAPVDATTYSVCMAY